MNKATAITLLSIILSSISVAQQWTNFTTVNSELPSNKVSSICVDDFGHLWFGTDNGLVRFDGMDWKIYQATSEKQTLAGNGLLNVIYDFFDSMHELWIATSNGVSVMEINADMDAFTYATPYFMANEDVLLPSNTVTSVAIDEHHARWFGTDAGIAGFFGSKWKAYKSADHFDLTSDNITSIFSKDDTTYFASIGGGVMRMTYYLDATTTASPLDNWGFIASNNVYSVFVDSRGAKWCGTDKGVSRFENRDLRVMGNWITFTTDTVFTSTLKKGIPYDSTYVIQGGALIDDMVTAIGEDKHGVLWFGTPKGVTRFDGKNWSSFSTNDGLVNNKINAIAADASGAVWFATDDGISKFDKNASFVSSDQAASRMKSFGVSNYPNPFNMNTTIEFNVPDYEFVTIKIVDLVGREVVQLTNNNLESGLHHIKWTGTDYNDNAVTSGVYFVQIMAGEYIATHKVIALK
jgi:ligand-binding sensor domain-containing protein